MFSQQSRPEPRNGPSDLSMSFCDLSTLSREVLAREMHSRRQLAQHGQKLSKSAPLQAHDSDSKLTFLTWICFAAQCKNLGSMYGFC